MEETFNKIMKDLLNKDPQEEEEESKKQENRINFDGFLEGENEDEVYTKEICETIS